MKVTEKYPLLGHKVRDKLTGFTGFCISAHDTFTGMIQYALAPECKAEEPSNMPTVKLLDYHTLEHLVPVPLSAVTGSLDAYHVPMEPAEDAWLDIGALVRDRILPKNEGIITERIVSLNGCVYYNVILQKTANKTDELEPKLLDSYRRFEVIGAGLSQQAKAQEKKDTTTDDGKPKMQKPGGPSRDLPKILGR